MTIEQEELSVTVYGDEGAYVRAYRSSRDQRICVAANNGDIAIVRLSTSEVVALAGTLLKLAAVLRADTRWREYERPST